MICIYVDLLLLYVDTKISGLKCAFSFFKLRIIQLLYIAQREVHRGLQYCTRYELLQHDA